MIIVTGAAGFIGSAVIWGLNKMGIRDILAVDELQHLGEHKKNNLAHVGYKQLIGRDELLEKLKGVTNVNAIIHLGACSSTTEKNEEYLRETNFEYTKHLAEYALANGVRFIYASSAATYGDGAKGFSDDHGKLKEYSPMNLYGRSKHMFDLWAQDKKVLDEMAGLKYFNVFGPNEYHKGDMRSFVLKAFEQINSTGRVRLFKSYKKEYADGEQVRDFIYIKDAVRMTLAFLENRDLGGIYNIGTGEPRSWNDLVTAVFNALEKPVEIEYVDMPGDIRDQYQYYTCADMNKLEEAGVELCDYSLEAGVFDYVKKYLIPSKYLTSPGL
ncbi:MAG: ADP-glyceromanno-heptose 6-epimerase [Elusimicrobia bacterium]|nr:ADP-glyceromanno-heptose 6-epimerase [Elusimicrobiota bacterium]